MTIVVHRPIEKRQQTEFNNQKLEEMFQRMGITTDEERQAFWDSRKITTEMLKQIGMKKLGRWGAHINEKVSESGFVLGERQAPMLIAGVSA